MIADAKLLLEGKRLKSAADRGYYAMFHAAHAALAANGVTAPRTHRGLRAEFSKQLVLPGMIEREYSRDLALGHQMRQESSYETYAEVDETAVSNLISRAEHFRTRIAQMVESD